MGVLPMKATVPGHHRPARTEAAAGSPPPETAGLDTGTGTGTGTFPSERFCLRDQPGTGKSSRPGLVRGGVMHDHDRTARVGDDVLAD
jgi:hypothetical protein